MKIVIQYLHILNLVLTRFKRNQSSMNYSLNKPLKKIKNLTLNKGSQYAIYLKKIVDRITLRY